MRHARLTMIVDATNDCAAASSSTETIEEKITSMVRMPGAFERQPLSTMNLCARALRHARVLRLEVDVDSDTRHLVSRAEPACRPVKRAAGPAAAAEKRSVSDLVGCKPSRVCVTILAARLFLCGMNISMYLASFRRYFGGP